MPAIYSIADVVSQHQLSQRHLDVFQLKDAQCVNQLLAQIMEDQKI